jgi:hypothetical protein
LTVVPRRDVAGLTTFVTGGKRKHGVNVCAMTRRLVLTNEAAGHAFRRSLPPVVVERPRDDDHDWKLFVLSFAAFFTCFYTFFL